MDRELGEIFTYKGKTYQVVKDIICENCSFTYPECYYLKNILGNCCNAARADETNVIFKEINNMEIKNNQLTIDIPEGMNIDIENSDLAKGIIKFKPKCITYDDIVSSFKFKTHTDIFVYTEGMNKLKAIVQLMNIDKYYNKDWRPNWNNSKENKYLINFDNHNSEFFINNGFTVSLGNVYFKNINYAQSVIDNPNFREILNAIYKY